ncbi:hypothetical protein A9Q84_02700 [Halobacteriovorax marinus]|uniref:HD-GYP domain-containing protein n=1 Tax=Halobacteriovorax marinus TaxID=97084 RepID=A0A1Y5FCZ8_9BACT|nr:hypothetical protein A9Q84_02700 [Halobacteriovorax marinus]
MKLPTNYFYIELEALGETKIFPFHLYIFNPTNNSYSAFLHANSPLTEDKIDFLEFILNKGGRLAVDMNQKRTFLTSSGLKEEEVPGLKEEEVHDLEVAREAHLKNLEEQSSTNGTVKFKEDLKNSLAEDDFMAMIERVKHETLTFSVRKSHTVSLASYLSEILLTEDSFINRIVAVSYFMAKNCDMKDEEALADIICGAFFCHLGMTQMDYKLTHKAHLEYTNEEKKQYKKHPNLSHHLLNKCGVELSERCKNVIFQHHERNDGSGYPMEKTGDHIDQLSLILGAVTHIFEYSGGFTTGSKTDMITVIRNLKNKTFTAGLEFEFGDKIYENIINLLSTDTIEEAA